MKTYASIETNDSPFVWEQESLPCLDAMRDVISKEYYSKLGLLWGQESNKSGGTTQLRSDNVTFIKTIGKLSMLNWLSWRWRWISQDVWESQTGRTSRCTRLFTVGVWQVQAALCGWNLGWSIEGWRIMYICLLDYLLIGRPKGPNTGLRIYLKTCGHGLLLGWIASSLKSNRIQSYSGIACSVYGNRLFCKCSSLKSHSRNSST